MHYNEKLHNRSNNTSGFSNGNGYKPARNMSRDYEPRNNRTTDNMFSTFDNKGHGSTSNRHKLSLDDLAK